MTLAFISHPDCELHDMGEHHPESPRRLQSIADHVQSGGLEPRITRYLAPLVAREALERVHDPEYVAAIFARSPKEGTAWLDPDTSMNPHSLNAALRAAGAGTLAVNLVLGGKAETAFCAVRPPGHHAEHNRAMGFCIFNNVAVAAAHALAEHGLERVAIVDFDVHHGNGTEDIFRNDGRVLFCSSFQHPFYPYSGEDTRSAHIVNVPLPAGSGSREFRDAITRHWLPALAAHHPQLILVSAGFDAHREDPLASLNLQEDDYAWVTGEICAIARAVCQDRVVSLLEGGYALDALGRSVAAHTGSLAGP